MPEFNLCDEKWIRVLYKNGDTAELSLTDALLKSHEYMDLCGEVPAQDIAVMRLMLAVLHTVVSRYNPEGEEDKLIDKKGTNGRWLEIWNSGKLPEKPIRKYLEKWRERFWLFHEERPFYQVKEAAIGTEYGTPKLNGELAESSNKYRIFQSCAGIEKSEMSFAETARGLIYINAFDDTSAKPKTKKDDEKLPSPGAGWLGKLGLITAVGDNFFETLMRNLVLLKEGDVLWEEDNLPVWEREAPATEERVEIALPKNPAELLTLQSRRLILDRKGDRVSGFRLLGGDFFPKENALSEQMTVWRTEKEKKNKPAAYVPKRHEPEKQMWREFNTFFASDEGGRTAGVIKWNNLINSRILKKQSLIKFKITSVHYGDSDYFIDDSFTDSIYFNSGILSEMGAGLRKMIGIEVESCKKLADAIGYFAIDIDKAAGGEGGWSVKSRAAEEFYSRIDILFRDWLQGLDLESGADDYFENWHKKAKKIAGEIGKEMAEAAGNQAYVGRTVKEKKGKTEEGIFYSVPKAYNSLLKNINNAYK